MVWMFKVESNEADQEKGTECPKFDDVRLEEERVLSMENGACGEQDAVIIRNLHKVGHAKKKITES